MSGVKGVIVAVSAALSALALVALVIIQFVGQSELQSELEDVRKEIRTDLRAPHYEYKVLTVRTEGHDRTGDGAMRFATVTPSETQLSTLGAAGWEVVSSYLELETAFPNFGNAGYVTGLQPNVRPQRLVILLRHRVG